MPPSLTLLIPCYNEQRNIHKSFATIEQYMAKHANVEAVFVDDASTDGTFISLKSNLEKSAWKEKITLLQNNKNLGKGGSIKAGIESAKTEYTCFTDADLAYDLNNLREFENHLHPGKLVIANRLHQGSCCHISPYFFPYIFYRHLLSRAFNGLVRWSLLPNVFDVQAGFKIGFTEDLKNFLPSIKNNGFSFDLELLLHYHGKKMKIVDLPVTYRYITNKSSVSIFKDGMLLLYSYAGLVVRKLRSEFQ